MSRADLQSELVLGTVGQLTLHLTPAILHASYEHARHIAAGLRSDAASSMAGYWSLPTRLEQWQRIVERIGPARAHTARFVEIGSGMGLFALVGSALGYQVAGVESSSDRYAASINIARELFHAHKLPLPIVQAYSEALPLPDASADLVASFQTFEHVANLEQTLREIRRILRPGGLLFAQAPNYTSFYEVHYAVLAPLALGKASTRGLLRFYGRPAGFLDHLQWLDPARLRELFAKTGFSSAQVGPIARPQSPLRLPAQAVPVPFHFRRGQRARWLANRLALASQALGLGADRYPQLEIWAIA